MAVPAPFFSAVAMVDNLYVAFFTRPRPLPLRTKEVVRRKKRGGGTKRTVFLLETVGGEGGAGIILSCRILISDEGYVIRHHVSSRKITRS